MRNTDMSKLNFFTQKVSLIFVLRWNYWPYRHLTTESLMFWQFFPWFTKLYFWLSERDGFILDQCVCVWGGGGTPPHTKHLCEDFKKNIPFDNARKCKNLEARGNKVLEQHGFARFIWNIVQIQVDLIFLSIYWSFSLYK